MSLLPQRTSLETTKNITEVLSAKLKQLEKNSLPVESGLADYIYMADADLDLQLEQLKALKKEISAREKEIKNQKEAIRIEGAEFLKNLGVDKLTGMLCSSVTVTPEKPAKETKEVKEEFVLLDDEKEIEELLISLGKAERKRIEIVKTTAPQPAKLRINKRRVHGTEVVV